jgi:hypothetical protein
MSSLVFYPFFLHKFPFAYIWYMRAYARVCGYSFFIDLFVLHT